MSALAPFHLAFPVHDLDAARSFYGALLGCPEGRSSEEWVDFNLYGHQIVAHLTPEPDTPRAPNSSSPTSMVDGHAVPVRHFGLVLSKPEWDTLATRLRAAEVEFIIEPGLRFAESAGAQWTLFISDPSGNALEFKSMVHPEALFSR